MPGNKFHNELIGAGLGAGFGGAAGPGLLNLLSHPVTQVLLQKAPFAVPALVDQLKYEPLQ